MTRSIIKTTKLFRFFLEGVRLRNSVLLIYNERAFLRPPYGQNRQTFESLLGSVKF